MGFNVTLQARGGNTTPDRTENRWNSNFITTVHNKAYGGFTLTKYKSIVTNADKWGQGVIRYTEPFKSNYVGWFMTNKRTEGGTIYYDIQFPDSANYGNNEFYVITNGGQARLYTTSAYVNKPTKPLSEYVHIWNAGGHPLYNFTDYPYAVTNKSNYAPSNGIWNIVAGSFIDQNYINTIFDLGNNKIGVDGPGNQQYSKYIFSNGESGYTEDSSFGSELTIPNNLLNDPNAWVQLIPNNTNTIYKNNRHPNYTESQKIPFNLVKRINGNYNLRNYIVGNIYNLRSALAPNTFNPNIHWYICGLTGWRSGSNVTLRFKYISSGRPDRVVVRNNNFTTSAISAQDVNGWAQVTVSCGDKGLFLSFYCNGRQQDAVIHID